MTAVDFNLRRRAGLAGASDRPNHPHICQLYDVGALPSGSGYLVMEYIEGEPLKRPMLLEDALRIARQVAAALDAAHEKASSTAI